MYRSDPDRAGQGQETPQDALLRDLSLLPPVATDADLTALQAQVDGIDADLDDAVDDINTVEADLATHAARTDNPHVVTVHQAVDADGGPDAGWIIGNGYDQREIDASDCNMNDLASFTATIARALIAKGILSDS